MGRKRKPPAFVFKDDLIERLKRERDEARGVARTLWQHPSHAFSDFNFVGNWPWLAEKTVDTSTRK